LIVLITISHRYCPPSNTALDLVVILWSSWLGAKRFPDNYHEASAAHKWSDFLMNRLPWFRDQYSESARVKPASYYLMQINKAELQTFALYYHNYHRENVFKSTDTLFLFDNYDKTIDLSEIKRLLTAKTSNSICLPRKTSNTVCWPYP